MSDPAADAFEALVAVDRPVYVVTTRAGDERSGCLVGFASQVSISPPRLLVCISRANHTHGVVAHAEDVAVHLIPRENRDLAVLFGGRTGDEVDKFTRCAWSDGPNGLPILDDAGLWLAGRIRERFDLGDHTGLLLEPVDGEVRRDTDSLPAWVGLADVVDVEPGHTA